MLSSARAPSGAITIVRSRDATARRVHFVAVQDGVELATYSVDEAYETPADGDLVLEHLRRRHDAIVDRRTIRLIRD